MAFHFSITQGCFVPRLIKSGDSREEDENVESLQTDGRLNDRQSAKLTRAFKSGELQSS